MIAALAWSAVALAVLRARIFGAAWFNDILFEICVFYLPLIILWMMAFMELREKNARR